MIKLAPHERLLVEKGVNGYYVAGPGLFWPKPWERALLTFNVGPQGQSLTIEQVRTDKDIPVNITLQLLYQVDPTLLTTDLLPKLPVLHEKGWQGVIKWRTEYFVRQLVAPCPWKELNEERVHSQLERRLAQMLGDALKWVGLKVMEVYLVKVALPDNLQHAIVQAEKDSFEPRSRALILKEYFDLFGNDLTRAMPYIIQWELVNILRKHSNPHLLLTNAGLGLGQLGPEPMQTLYRQLSFLGDN